MNLRIGDTAPDFEAETSNGRLSLYEWMGDSWCVLFSHPKDFTPVCTTELGAMARMEPEFGRRGVKLMGLSVDPVEDHLAWFSDIEATQGVAPDYPVVGDTDLSIAKLYGMLPADAGTTSKARTAADNFTVRSLFVIAPDKTIRLMMTYPMNTGRSVAEVLRVVDSLQLTEMHKVGTPAGWQSGEPVVILPSIPDAEARQRFPDGWKAPRPYLRIVNQPA